MEPLLVGDLDTPGVHVRLRCGRCRNRRRPAPIMAWMETYLDLTLGRRVPGRWTIAPATRLQGTDMDSGAATRRMSPDAEPVGRAVELHCRGCGARPRLQRSRLCAQANDLRAVTLAGERAHVERDGFLTLHVV